MNGGSAASYLARTPCAPLLILCLVRVETEGLLDYQGRAGIISIVRWNLHPVIFGVDLSSWVGADEVDELGSRFSEPIFGKGMRRKGGGNSVNRGFAMDFYTKGNPVKRFRPFTEPPDSEN